MVLRTGGHVVEVLIGDGKMCHQGKEEAGAPA